MVPLQPMMNMCYELLKANGLKQLLHMTKFEFLNLPRPKQVQLIISIHIHRKFCLLTTSTLVGFQKDIQQFILQAKTNLKVETSIVFSTIITNDNVQRSVKLNLILLNQNQFLNKNPLRH